MSDFTMCNNQSCPVLDNCWRANAPPKLRLQAWDCFEFDEDAFEEAEGVNYEAGCKFFMRWPDFG